MLALARGFLERKGLGEARLEAELLVAHALKVDRLGLFMRLDAPIQGAEVDLARDCLVRRGRREPTAYIVGQREFFGRDFAVGPGALVPRPETELIVDLARERIPSERTQGLRVADVGTGSGCLAVTLALELEGAVVDAIDLNANGLGLVLPPELLEGTRVLLSFRLDEHEFSRLPAMVRHKLGVSGGVRFEPWPERERLKLLEFLVRVYESIA